MQSRFLVVNKAPLLPKPACLYAVISLHPRVCFPLPPHVRRGEGIPSGNDAFSPCLSERSHPSVSGGVQWRTPPTPILNPHLQSSLVGFGKNVAPMDSDKANVLESTSKHHQHLIIHCEDPVNTITTQFQLFMPLTRKHIDLLS